ncbi:hypothetical protein CesoFtcFv8_007581 [Champsocephalus esox]|uniref:Homeobox domain-containing protein n=1 Tax=Champsocephalus esox TaxID=159716 RepID=A0AAN8CEY5_9TELE|nr:hypothetical protein CesoFtcFv8_007581 [Champsocephalus esox]
MWLPEKVSWSDLEDSEGRVYAKASQLYAALPCALCLLLVRFLFERYLATPLADLWGVRDHVRLTPETNPILEKHFCSQARVLSQADLRSLCKKTSWPERKVQVWFKRRKEPGAPRSSQEVLRGQKPWLYNLKEVWAGIPKQIPQFLPLCVSRP